MMPRGTGETARQLKDAPQGATFVWCTDDLAYPKRLAIALKREDIHIVGVTWALGHFMGAERAVNVPVGLMMGQVALVLGLPVTLGMVVRHRWTRWALWFEPRATRIATLLFVLIVVLAVVKNWVLLGDNFAKLAPFALALNLTMLTVGFTMAWLARLSRSQSITLGIGTAVQNAALALVIASTVLKDDAMAIPGALYGVLMYAGGLLFAFTMRRFMTAPVVAQTQH